MTTLMEHFEQTHLDLFATCARMPLPTRTWLTPNGECWTPQRVLNGWHPSTSDRWGWLQLDAWTRGGLVDVSHIELPCELRAHDRDDRAWQHVASFGDGDPEFEPAAQIGRADMLVGFNDEKLALFIEMGTCSPAKFALNLGLTGNDWMIVPYGCLYGFVFSPQNPPLIRRTNKHLDDADVRISIQ